MDLISSKQPDIICLQEAIEENVREISNALNYKMIFSPYVIIDYGNKKSCAGISILSKNTLSNIKILRYDSNDTTNLPIQSIDNIDQKKDGKRSGDRFKFFSSILSGSITIENKRVTIATTHFPVADHTSRGHIDHSLNNIDCIEDILIVREYFDRFMKQTDALDRPLIFTADLNNPRGEYIYDTLAHSLIDLMPKEIESTIDPNVHRMGDQLKLVVDTIMVSPEISPSSIEIIEGVSDHKAVFANINI
jgi:exonuclease III